VCALGPLAQGPRRTIHEPKEGAATMDEDDDGGIAAAPDPTPALVEEVD
jgi:hypothetical protein